MFRLIIVTFLYFLGSFSFAQNEKYVPAEEPERILKELQNVSKATSSIEASFTETKHIAILTTPQVAKGKMYYKQENKMKWEQKTPFEYIILINGDQLRIKDNGKEKHFQDGGKIASKVNGFMMSLIQGEYQDNNAYDSEFLTSKNNYLVVLDPKVKSLSKVYDKLELYFSKQDLRLFRMEFYETGGDQRSVEFYDQKYNSTINESIFQNL